MIDASLKTVQANNTEYSVIDIGFSGKDGKDSARVCDFIYMNAVKPVYEFDSSVAYFVDCGDQDTTTATGSDKFGLYNCLTEQLYGVDEVTGAEWGLIDDATDQYNGSSKGGGLYTANTWCNEYAPADGADKSSSFRYTKNQYENNIDRHIDYAFSLPNGKYTVEMAFADPWNCSKNPTVYANYGKDDQTVVAKNCATDGTAVKGSVTVTDGKLTLNFRSEDKAINVSYIKISFDGKTTLPAASLKGDVNQDGKIDAKDAAALRDYLLIKTKTLAAPTNADINGDGKLNAVDLALLKRLAK